MRPASEGNQQPESNLTAVKLGCVRIQVDAARTQTYLHSFYSNFYVDCYSDVLSLLFQLENNL